MAQKDLKQKVIKLRLQGMSYSQIKEKAKISKSTLSEWLREYPLSEQRIKALRDNNPKRIERFRNTMALKKEERLKIAYKKASSDIGRLAQPLPRPLAAGLLVGKTENPRFSDIL